MLANLVAALAVLSLGQARTDPETSKATLDPTPFARVLAVSVDTTSGVPCAFAILGMNNEETGRALAAYCWTGTAWSLVTLEERPELRPWDVSVAQFDDDPAPELIVAVRKRTRRDAEIRDRLFVFDWDGQQITPKWLGSHLGQPLVAWFVESSPAQGRENHGQVPLSPPRTNLVCVQRSGSTVALRRLVWSGFGFALHEELARIENTHATEGGADAGVESLIEELARRAAQCGEVAHRLPWRGDVP